MRTCFVLLLALALATAGAASAQAKSSKVDGESEESGSGGSGSGSGGSGSGGSGSGGSGNSGSGSGNSGSGSGNSGSGGGGSGSSKSTKVVQQGAGKLEVVDHEVLVLLEADGTSSDLEDLADLFGAVVVEWAPLSNAGTLLHLGTDAEFDALVRDLGDEPRVRYAGSHHVAKGDSVSVPQGASAVTLDAVDNHVFVTDAAGTTSAPEYEGLQWNLRHMRAGDAFEAGLSGDGVVVAVLDTGIAYENVSDASGTYALAPDLAHVEFVSPLDLVHGDLHANDDNGHGTQMATLLAGLGATAPIAPNVALMPVKVLDQARVGTEIWLAEGILHAVASGADVINMSLAFPEGYAPSPVLENALTQALEAGVVLVAAAGNDGGSWTPFPAAFPGVIAVGGYRSVDPADDFAEAGVRATYSNGSAGLDVLGPGGSHDHDLDQNGYPDAALSMTFDPADPAAFGTWFVSGTSGAAAQVSGLVALLLEAGDPPADVPVRLRATAWRQAGTRPFDAVRGAGLARIGASVAAALEAPLDPACAQARVFANPTGAIFEPATGYRAARFAVEVVGGSLEPLAGARVYARISGSTQANVLASTDAAGIARFSAPGIRTKNAPEGAMWFLHVEAIEIAVPGCPTPASIVRPTIFTRMDELSYRLAEDFGAGMASSALVLLADPSVAGLFPGVDPSTWRSTYLQRPVGSGMASSALVGAFDRTAMEATGRIDEVVVFRSFGTGMASSALVLDMGWVDPAVLDAYTPKTVLARSFPVGSGMASSALVVDGVELPADHYVSAFANDPALVMVNHGGGRISSARVFDRGLLHPDLLSSADPSAFQAMTSGATVSGAGMASSALVFDYGSGDDPMGWLLDAAGHPPTVGETVAGGTRLSDSSLVARHSASRVLGSAGAHATTVAGTSPVP